LILLALVATLESFHFNLSLLPALDQEVAYPFIDWDAEEEGEGGGEGRAGKQKKKKKDRNKSPPPLKEREGGREGSSPYPVPPSPRTLMRGLDAAKLEDEEEMKRMRQALLHNPMYVCLGREGGREGGGEEEGRVLLAYMSFSSSQGEGKGGREGGREIDLLT